MTEQPKPYVSNVARDDHASSAATPEVLHFGRRLVELQAAFEEQRIFMYLGIYRVIPGKDKPEVLMLSEKLTPLFRGK